MKKFLIILSAIFLVFGVSELTIALPTYQLGPDTIADGPVSPYTFTNAAAGYGYKLEISPNPTPGWELHVPIFTLTNTSTNDWAKIISFEFAIGDTNYNFDHLGVEGRDALGAFSADLNSDGSYGHSTPDNQDNVIRSDFILYSDYTGFDRGDVFTFMADVDIDGANFPGSVENFQQIFWNNGDAPNSEITVTFAGIPAPGAVMLGSIGIGLVAWLRRRRIV